MKRAARKVIGMHTSSAAVLVCLSLLPYSKVIRLWWTYDDANILRTTFDYRFIDTYLKPHIWPQQLFTPLLILACDAQWRLFAFRSSHWYAMQLAIGCVATLLVYAAVRQFLDTKLWLRTAAIFTAGVPVVCARRLHVPRLRVRADTLMAGRLALLFLLIAAPAFTRNHAVLPPQAFDFGPAQNILWIGAHPDDEVLASPFLGVACKESGARCTFLVMTRGEAGNCGLPEGCLPDLGTVRAAEMRAASEIFGAQLIQWRLPNTNAPTPFAAEMAWEDVSGGREELLSRIRGVIDAIKPTTIVTFDPAHGSTCHPEHRAVASLVLDATHGSDAKLLLIETRIQFLENGFLFSSAVQRPSLRLDGARKLSPEGRLPWDYLLLDVQQHRSQFTPEQIQLLREVPREQRYVDFAEPSAAPTVSPCP